MKKTISLLVALLLCVSLVACGNSKNVKSLMNGFEWGQTSAQIQKNIAKHSGNYVVCGLLVEDLVIDIYGPLDSLRYVISSEEVAEEDATEKVYDLLIDDYNTVKESLIDLFGEPDSDKEYDVTEYDALQYRNVTYWYIEDDIVRLELGRERKVSSTPSYAMFQFTDVTYTYALKLDLEHTA